MYVAMTRARNHLAVSYPLNVYNTRRGADYSFDQLSRFLDRGVRKAFERVVLETPATAPEVASSTVNSTVDVRAMLRARFGGASDAPG